MAPPGRCRSKSGSSATPSPNASSIALPARRRGCQPLQIAPYAWNEPARGNLTEVVLWRPSRIAARREQEQSKREEAAEAAAASQAEADAAAEAAKQAEAERVRAEAEALRAAEKQRFEAEQQRLREIDSKKKKDASTQEMQAAKDLEDDLYGGFGKS